MASDIWLRTILIVRKETRCRHIGYSFRLTANVLLYAPSHRQDSTYHSLCYTSRGALAGTRNSSMGPPWERERNVLFNDALNTFYLRLYGIKHMVRDHSDSEKGNPLPPHRLLFSIISKGFIYMHHPTYRISHTTAFVTPVVEHWLEREIAQWVHHERSMWWANALTTE